MKNKTHTIKNVRDGSIAWEMEIQPGDELLSINGEPVEDIFDYRYLTNEEYLEVLIRKPGGEEWAWNLRTALWTNTTPAGTSAFSALLTRCRKACGKPCILKTTTPACPFSREIM